MKIENHVCSLELSKKLKELNVKQDSIFFWIKGPNPKSKYILSMKDGFNEVYHEDDMISAFLTSELGDILPEDYITIRGKGGTKKDPEIKMYWICYNDIDGIDKSSTQMELKESDAQAKMLIYLIENKLIEINK